MSSSKLQQTRQSLTDSIRRARKQLGYLTKELSHHPSDGFLWWLKNHQQYPALEIAVEKILLRSEQLDFDVQEVFDSLSAFKLRDEDYAHIEWYAQAHTKIAALNTRLNAGDILIQGIFRGVMTELKYIIEAKAFHTYWGLLPLHDKVIKMYQQLLSKIDELKDAAIEQQKLESKQLVINEKKLELDKIRTQKEALQIQKDKAELVKEKIVQEKLYREAKHQEHLEGQKLVQMREKQHQIETETQRIADLQSSYADIAKKWDKQLPEDNDDQE